MLEVYVPRGCRNACPISHLARIEDEKEVLMPPYSPVLVKGHRRRGSYNVIEVEVLDGQIVHHCEGGHFNPSQIGMENAMSTFRALSRACVC